MSQVQAQSPANDWSP